MMDALILAGSSNIGPLSACCSDEYEPLIDICSRPMVEYVLQSVRKSEYISRIILVGPVENLKGRLEETPDEYIPMGESLFDNLKKGVGGLDKDKLVLVITGDIPLLTPEAIDDFIEKALKNEGDIFYPLVPKEICQQAYPNMQRTYIRLREGVFTGGNIFLLKPRVIEDEDSPLAKAISLRKSTLHLGRLLGLPFLLLFLTGKLSIKQIERKVSKAFGYNGMGIITDYPEIAFDVDKPSDLELVGQFIDKTESCS